MAAPKFYLEKRKDNTGNIKKFDLPIIMKYSFNRQRLEYYTGCRTDSRYYREKYYTMGKPAIRTDAPGYEGISANLDFLIELIGTIEKQAIAEKSMLTPEYLKEKLDILYKGKVKTEPKRITFFEYFDAYIKKLPQRVNEATGHKLSKEAEKKYRSVYNMLQDFVSYRGQSFDFNDIDKDFYNELIEFMINERQYSINTYGRAIKFIKTILHAAVADGLNSKLDFMRDFKGKT
jgi:hypothetical protein